MSEKLKNLLFTHDDLDGGGCKIVFELFYGINSRYIKTGNDAVISSVSNLTNVVNEWLFNKDFVDEDTHIYFADISPNRALANKLLEKFHADHIHVIDHHQSALWLNDYHGIDAHIIPVNDLKINQCGTTLLLDYLMAREPEITERYFTHRAFIDYFVENIRLYDTFDMKKVGAEFPRELNALFFLLGSERFCNYYTKKIWNTLLNGWQLADSVIPDEFQLFVDYKLEREEQAIERFLESGKVYTISYPINGEQIHVAFVINSFGANQSELAVRYLAVHPEIDVVAFYSMASNALSFRSARDDVNVAKNFAVPLGGGGHPKASGATLEDNIQTLLYDTVTDVIGGKICGTNR